MANRVFFTFALSLFGALTTLRSYTQTFDATLGTYTSGPTLDYHLYTLRKHFDSRTFEYTQKRSYREGKGKVYLQSAVEFPAIAKGDTTRIRYVFDNSVIAHIEIEGVGETTPQDIERGFFDVTVSPEQTTLYKTNIHVKSADSTIVVLEGTANRRVIVIDGDRKEYSRVMDNIWWKEIDKNKPTEFYRYLNSIAGDVPEGLWVYSPEKLNEYLGRISGKEYDMQLAIKDIPDTKTLLQRETERFDSVKLNPEKWLTTAIEHMVIARGDSTRIKFVFDNRRVRGIQVLGYGRASREDIKRGEYIATVTPQKTKLIECYVNTGGRIPAYYRVIVIDPEQYDEVLRKLHISRIQGGYHKYLEELADGVPSF